MSYGQYGGGGFGGGGYGGGGASFGGGAGAGGANPYAGVDQLSLQDILALERAQRANVANA